MRCSSSCGGELVGGRRHRRQRLAAAAAAHYASDLSSIAVTVKPDPAQRRGLCAGSDPALFELTIVPRGVLDQLSILIEVHESTNGQASFGAQSASVSRLPRCC